MKEEVSKKLIGIYFKKCYMGFGKVSKEEQEYLDSHDFICIVTNRTKNNGYKSDGEHVSKHLEVGKEYALQDMSVSQSSSTLRLKELPNIWFNTVNFEIYQTPKNK